RRLAAQQGRHRRRRHARPRPRDGRDDRRRARDRLVGTDHVAPLLTGRLHAGGDREPVRRGIRSAPLPAHRPRPPPALHHDRRQHRRPRDRAAVAGQVEGRLMAATAPTPSVDLKDHESWRRWKSNIAIGLMVFALLLVSLPLVLVLYTVISRGIDVISW